MSLQMTRFDSRVRSLENGQLVPSSQVWSTGLKFTFNIELWYHSNSWGSLSVVSQRWNFAIYWVECENKIIVEKIYQVMILWHLLCMFYIFWQCMICLKIMEYNMGWINKFISYVPLIIYWRKLFRHVCKWYCCG